MPSTFPRLTVRDAFGNQREIEITRTPFTLGRQSDNDLVLLDSRISRRHARIVQGESGYLIEDLGSRHGIFVNSERIQTAPLKSGDQINLGIADSYTLSFAVEAAVLPGLLEKFEQAAASPAPQLHHLSLLLQMAQILHRAPALEEVLITLVDSALQLANAERGLLFLREGGDLRLHMARGAGGVHLGTDMLDYSKTVVNRVARTGQEECILESEMTGKTAQETGIIRGGVRGIVALPLQKLPMTEATGETIMRTAPELLGVLYLDTHSHPTAVTGLDRQVLQSLAVEGATVIENARMFRLTREQERLQHEFFLARNIQQSLLPRELPKSDYFQFFAVTMPTEAVGGDYYDVVHLPDNRFGFVVADVSGKGLPAAMLAASLQGAFAAVAAGAPELSNLFRRVNDFLCERTPPEMFATVFYGVLGREGDFEFVNAGHVPPLVIRRGGAVEQLASSNFPVGLFARATFTVDRTQLRPGDLIAICSDGVTEARDTHGELFGEHRLREFLEDCARHAAEDVCRRVVARVHEFVGQAPQSDDITLTVLHYGVGQTGA
ncbi:MAG: SpoIIE family protein phosphatase [Acidobacteriia bacterium]|nr:SpoIIE family protein phosphatase [Terriglobia bacterium]